MSFPVPKMYKSSDRYNSGTDVIYDDDDGTAVAAVWTFTASTETDIMTLEQGNG